MRVVLCHHNSGMHAGVTKDNKEDYVRYCLLKKRVGQVFVALV